MKMFTMKDLLRSLGVAGSIILMGFQNPSIAQSCTLPTISTSPSYNYADRLVAFSSVSLNSGGNTAQVTGGQTVTLSFSWSTSAAGTYCPTCKVQLYVGINGNFTECLTSGFTQYTASGSKNISFTAPTTAGIYYITSTGTLDFSCQNISTPLCDVSTLAAIRVGNPSQTADVAITGDASFCPSSSASLSANLTGIFCTPSTVIGRAHV